MRTAKWIPRKLYFKLKKLKQLPWQINKNKAVQTIKKKRKIKIKSRIQRKKVTKLTKNYTVYIKGEPQNELVSATSAFQAERKAHKLFKTKNLMVGIDND
jgi:hypothetical protein